MDFLEAGERKSGDAIALRYGDGINPETVHVVDGGYTDDGQKLIEHIQKEYDKKYHIDHVILTHPDGDHACGLKHIIETHSIRELWMNRPWLYIDELLPLFEYTYTREGLIRRLKESYSHTAELEEIAVRNGVQINDVFQGSQVGAFTVLAPSRSRYLNLVVHSDKTPEPKDAPTSTERIIHGLVSAVRYVTSLWGEENLKGHTEGTSHENEMSVVQYAQLCDESILLTGDAGVGTLEEAHQYAIQLGITTPVSRFQVPHHGSRRNLSSEILDKWLGTKLPAELPASGISVAISANNKDADHPRKAVIRAVKHRGASILTTKGMSKSYWFKGKPLRADWSVSEDVPYPQDMEE